MKLIGNFFRDNFNNRKKFIFFIIILTVAIFLRLFFLTKGYILGDEPLYSIRGLTWLDVLYGSDQVTTYNLIEKDAWWLNLSFHDHPPLVFAIHHIFFSLFGVSLLVARLPPAIFGIFTVILSYFIGKKVYNKDFGLLVMLVSALNVMMGFFSRVSLMESIAIFFILLGFYFFLLTLDNKKFLPYFGIVLGLSFLAKYTAFFALPVYLIIFVFFRRSYFTEKRFYLSTLLALVVFSPVIIYNFFLYRNAGHFDLQFSYLLGQDVTYWSSLAGKVLTGNIHQRFIGIKNYIIYLSPFFIFFTLVGFVYFLCRVKKIVKEPKILTLFLLTFSFLLSLFLVGSSFRFLVYSVPFFCFLVAISIFSVINFLKNKNKVSLYIFYFLLGLFFMSELIISFNANILGVVNNSIGVGSFIFLDAYKDNDYGVDELGNYFKKELFQKKSLIDPHFSNKIINDRAEKLRLDNYKEEYVGENILIIHDGRLHPKTMNWVLADLTFNHGWPVIGLGDFIQNWDFISNNSVFRDSDCYFIISTNKTARSRIARTDPNLMAIDLYGKVLQEYGFVPYLVKNDEGEVVFEIYKGIISDFSILGRIVIEKRGVN